MSPKKECDEQERGGGEVCLERGRGVVCLERGRWEVCLKRKRGTEEEEEMCDGREVGGGIRRRGMGRGREEELSTGERGVVRGGRRSSRRRTQF